MTSLMDDHDARSGSATSVLRTIVGSSLRRLGGWIAAAPLIRLMADAGVPESRARTALVRVRSKGLLAAETRAGVPGYRLCEAALPMLDRGDRRIYSAQQMRVEDDWCLVSYSFPEGQRDLRHQLRRRLSAIGCGTVAAGLWICPEHQTADVEAILDDLGARAAATVFVAAHARTPEGVDAAVSRWWNLPAIAARHQVFLDGCADLPEANAPAREAFAAWIGCLDRWRVIPYLDPGLPLEWLPEDWPGRRSIPLFQRLRDELQDRSAEHVRLVATEAAG